MKTLASLMLIFLLAIQTVSQEESRIAFGIFVDNTGSLRTQIDKELEAAQEVLNQIKSGSFVFLFAFATDPNSNSRMARIAMGAQCSTDRDLVRRQIDGLFTVPGQTTLFDSIKTSAEYLDAKKPDNCSKFSAQNLVLISDGEDRASAIKEKELIAFLKAQNVRVSAIGLIEELSDEGGFFGKSPKQKSREFLEKLTKGTGGNLVFPKKKQSMEEVVKKLFESDKNSSK